MIINNEILIADNDVYILAKSRNYIIVNDGYCGLCVYGNDMRYVKSIAMSNDLLISHAFSNDVTDMIVVSDLENEKLYIVDLDKEGGRVREIHRSEIFLDYYIQHRDSFFIRDATLIFSMSSKDGKELSRSCYQFENLLAYSQKEELVEIEGRIFLRTEGVLRAVPVEYQTDGSYSVSDGRVLEYYEGGFRIHDSSGLLFQSEPEPIWEIRKAILRKNKAYVLLNHRSNIFESKLQEYAYPDWRSN